MADYVNNKELYAEIVKWKEANQYAIDNGLPPVKQNDRIGKAIIDISKGLASSWRFSGYTNAWKDEMIGDAQEMCVKGLMNFNPKYTNAHAYITMACFNAFIQRIKKEKRQQATIYKSFVENVADSIDPEMQAYGLNEEFIQDMHDKVNQYEQTKKSVQQEPNGDEEKADDIMDFLYDMHGDKPK